MERARAAGRPRVVPDPPGAVPPLPADPELVRLADQDRDGVSAEILYPTVGMMLCNHPDFDYKHACFQAYNTWIAEYCGAPYMFRVKTAEGGTVYRTDIHSRWQIGRGSANPRGGRWEGDPKALPNESEIPITSPVERISGPSIGSNSRNLLNGKTASFTDT